MPALSLFNKKWTPEPFSGCWLWTAAQYPTGMGYGTFLFQGRTTPAHRASWEIYRGKIPDGICVLHKCDTPLCVNPDHLWLGTKLDNSRDAVSKGRRPSQRGDKNGNCKLSEDQVRMVRSSPIPNTRMAKQLGIDRQTVWRIRTQISWKHLKE